MLKKKGYAEQAAPFCSTNYWLFQCPSGFLDNVTCRVLLSMSLESAAKDGPVVSDFTSVLTYPLMPESCLAPNLTQGSYFKKLQEALELFFLQEVWSSTRIEQLERQNLDGYLCWARQMSETHILT